MTSIQARTVKQGIKLSKLLSEPITAENLSAKRLAYAKLSKRFTVPRSVRFKPVKVDGFSGEWVDVPGQSSNKVMLYFHGGGFVFDSSSVHRELISRVATAGKIRALSVHYSLSPEYPYPAPINEGLAAYKWLLKTFRSGNIVFAGDSAGGSIVLSLLLMLKEQGLPSPACAIAISPATDATVDVKAAYASQANKDFFIRPDNLEFFMNAYFQKTPRNDPIASPLYGDPSHLPPLLVHVDKDELMYDGVKRFVAKARHAGVSVNLFESKGLWHVWHLFARFVPEAKSAINEIGEFIQAHTS